MLRRLLIALAVLGCGVATAAGVSATRVETPPPGYHPIERDADLLEALDLARPDLARVAGLYRAHRIEAALAALVAHFRARSQPLPPDVPDAKGLGEADAILAGRIGVGGAFPPLTVKLPYDWDANPYNDPEAVVGLARHSFLTSLVAAYRMTGEDRYLRSAAAYVQDWTVGSREARYLQGEPIRVGAREQLWMPRSFWLNASARLRGPWLALFFAARHSRALSDRMVLLLLRMIYNQADYILATMVPGDNRTATAADALDAVGLLFPEFRRRSAWRGAAQAALLRVAERQFAPDGVHVEMSPHYELVTLRSLAQPLLLEAHNGISPDRQILSVIERGLDYLVGVSDPARNLPVLKHSDRTPLPPLLKPLLTLFPARRDFEFIATDGAKGQPPPYRSKAFPYAGQVAFRNGWGPDAIYLLFDGGPMGKLPHEDKLGIEMSGFGAPLLADPGRHSYNRAPIDMYLWSSKAHSVILVDGAGQDRANCPKSTWKPTRPTSIALRRDGDDEAATARFAGPWKSGAKVVHRREVRFIRHRLFLIVDRLVPEDGRPHAYDGRFQLAEGDAEVRGKEVVFHAENGWAGLVIARMSFPGTVPEPVIVKGSEHPPGGWIAPKYGRLVPAPSVRYAAAPVAGPAVFVTALVPFRGTAAPDVALEGVSDHGGTPQAVSITVNSLETSVVLPLDAAGNSSSLQAVREPPCTP
jgi:hypothetical protein